MQQGDGDETASTHPEQAQEVVLTDEEQAVVDQNVVCMYTLQVLQGLVLGMCMGPVFDKYLLTLGGTSHLVPHHARNTFVGFTESVSGVTSMIMAIPVGIMVDRTPEKRARLLRLAFIFSIVGSVVAVFGILFDELITLYVSLVSMGAYLELSSSASEAIFADSIPKGRRSEKMVRKSILSVAASGSGPLLAAMLLFLLGNDWTLFQMKVVLILGIILLPFINVCLFWFRDPPAKLLQTEVETEAESSTAEGATQNGAERRIVAKRFGPLKQRHIPYILALSDFATCIGAGMTVKFFNLFFIQDMNFSPVNINLLQAAYPVVIAGFMRLTKKFADPCGRAQASWTFFMMNTFCLFFLAQIQSLPLLVVLFLIRGGFANSTYPIDRSILMDFTPSTQRGCWNAVESFTSMTWTGSAFLGGVLSDSKDYRFTFRITALVYFTACMLYLPLMVLVPRKEGQVGRRHAGVGYQSSTCWGSST